jgi:Tol biopolymer transport system component
LSPDSRLLAYACRDSGHLDIYARKLGSDDASNLTADSRADNWQPAFSPDGRSIAFRSERDRGGIWLMTVEGHETRRLSDFGYHPSWSPDGKQVLISDKTFDSPEDGPRQRAGALYAVDIATGRTRRVTDDTVYDAVQPAWSPHGRRVAYWGSDENGNRDIWTISAGEPSRPVAATKDAWIDWNPRWSPDGRHLYFVSDRDGAMNVWRVRIDEDSGMVAGDPEPVRTPSAYSADISLSIDERRIAYTNRQISTRIYRAPFDPAAGVDRAAAVAVTRSGERFREPNLSPDGAWLAVRIQDPQEDIGLIRPDGTGLRRLTNDQFKDRLPQWSPDGSSLYFLSNRGGAFEQWAIQPDGGGLRRISPSMRTVWWPDGSLVGFPATGKPFVLEPDGRSFAARPLPRDFTPELWSPDGRSVIGRGPAAAGQAARPMVYSVDDGAWAFADNAVAPVWLHDGSRFLYRQDGDIRIADLHAHLTRPVLSAPGNGLHDRFALSRDEKGIFFVLTEVADTIWLAERR